jgi:Na+/H+-dicarboxylate symporter
MILGVAVGYACHLAVGDLKATAGVFSIVADVFLRLVRMIIAPLVFTTLVSGVANMDDRKSLGRIGLKTLTWFAAASLASLSIGLLLANLTHPGIASSLSRPSPGAETHLAPPSLNWQDFVVHIFPRSLFEAMAGNDIMQILIFALFFGVALGELDNEPGRRIRETIDGVQEVMLRVTNAVMWFAPVGIFASLAAVVTLQGLSVLLTYGRLIGSFYLALACLWTVLLIAGGAVLNRRVLDLVKLIRAPMMLAFSTASSEAAYPLMLERLQRFGVKRQLLGFVLPLGYSFNLDGSMIYQSFAAVFIAQAFDVHMSLNQQITMLLVLMVSSKGMAAVPRGSLAVITATLPMFGLPEAGVMLVMGVDQFLDMGRTATNVLGNSVAAAVLARWENELASPEPVPTGVS